MLNTHILSARTKDGEVNLNPLNSGYQKTMHKIAYRNAAFDKTGAPRIETKQDYNNVLNFVLNQEKDQMSVNPIAMQEQKKMDMIPTEIVEAATEPVIEQGLADFDFF